MIGGAEAVIVDIDFPGDMRQRIQGMIKGSAITRFLH